ncbi:anti-sigma factor family protein [Heyndrickxia ginsengihumi]|uniref:anti-sigma factor family protein n=1 Tax=Heyndrickxia ginsengihumi TaxID=363870 RepID=UPI00203D7E85|nr:zf-HC2 domain-containing protein [Heyndrickxia ginsengihumi]MCM3023312.1 zf-HC2 domain-containing protein [Heyndrickxia ginsengihumi]
MGEHVEDLLSAYIDHELDEKDLLVVERHISVCPSCQQELDHLKMIQEEMIRFYQDIEITSMNFEKAVTAKILNEEVRMVLSYRGFIWFFVLCFAILSVLMYPLFRASFYVGINIGSALVNIFISAFNLAVSLLSTVPNLFGIIGVITFIILAFCSWSVFRLLRIKPVEE